MSDSMPPGEPTAATDDRVTVDVEYSENLSTRIRVSGSADAVKRIGADIVCKIRRDDMETRERQGYRRQFFSAAHWVVFVVAALSIAGMTAHFLNVRQFNLMFLIGMGAWTLGSVIYLYLVIIRDAFGVKEPISKPPRH